MRGRRQGTAAAGGLGGGDVGQLWFKLNLTACDAVQGETIAPSITYGALCIEPQPGRGGRLLRPSAAPFQCGTARRGRMAPDQRFYYMGLARAAHARPPSTQAAS